MELEATSVSNSRLISLYLNYQLNIHLKPEVALKVWFERLNTIVKQDRNTKTLETFRSKKSDSNIFSNNNLVVFVSLQNSTFRISQFSTNAPGFFEREGSEMKGMLLQELLPHDIRSLHDRFVIDFINQKSAPIVKTGALTSFGVTKSNQLRMLTVVIKLDYYMLEDIYLAGIMIPHPQNQTHMVLSDTQGKVLSMNEQAQELLGTGVSEFPYKLFLSIPRLIKYYYPEVKKMIKYKKMIKKK